MTGSRWQQDEFSEEGVEAQKKLNREFKKQARKKKVVKKAAAKAGGMIASENDE